MKKIFRYGQSFTSILRQAQDKSSFTLIELLVVLAIVAILSVVVIMTLNPSELLKQARDSNRLSDLSTLNTALSAYSADVNGGFMGTSTVVYVSLVDTTSSTCSGLGLPALPTGYTYNCPTSTANLKRADGTGWIPVNFSNISFGSPLSSLPVDPINTTSSRNYYTYVSGGSYELAATLEAAKNKLGGASDKVSSDGGDSTSLYEAGNNRNLLPVDYGDSSLLGYWNFEEGSGATSADSSGMGYGGTWVGTSTNWYVSPGKVGSYAATLNNINDGLSVSNANFAGLQDYSMSAWIYPRGLHKNYTGSIISSGNWNSSFWVFGVNKGNTSAEFRSADGTGAARSSSHSFSLNTWHHVAAVRTGAILQFFVNGLALSPIAIETGVLESDASNTTIGRETYTANGYFTFNGYIDSVRVYNRALSAAEVLAIYNATK